MTEQLLVVDRIEGDVAVLVDDEQRTLEVETQQLPAGIREGSVLRVSVDAVQGPDWRRAFVDEQAQSDRIKRAEEILRRLKSRDPGGDVSL